MSRIEMGINYDKYIKRLRVKRADNPEYAFYRQTMQSMTEPLKRINNTMQGQLNMAGGSTGARAQAGLNSQNSLQGFASNLYDTADRSGIARNDALDSQIMNLETQRDQEAEAKKNAGLKGAIQIGATALGAGVGSIVPGAGTMLGAQIGAGVGGIAGSFVGGGGKMGLNYVDPAELAQGIGDTLAGISSVSTLKEHKIFTKKFGELYSAIPENASTRDLSFAYNMIIGGDYEGGLAALQSIVDKGAVTDTTTATPNSVDMSHYLPVGQHAAPAQTMPISGVTNKGTIHDTTDQDFANMITKPAEPAKAETKSETKSETKGTGKTYAQWQGAVNSGDMSAQTIKMRNIESFKERGYYVNAKGAKVTTKPAGYSEYYGE
jgi:hypothetical protein